MMGWGKMMGRDLGGDQGGAAAAPLACGRGAWGSISPAGERSKVPSDLNLLHLLHRRAGLLFLALMALMVPVGPAAADDAPPKLVYFLMDTNRSVADKASDIKVIDQVIAQTLAAVPGVRFFFHLTNLRLPRDNVDNLLFDGTAERDGVRSSVLRYYAQASLPERLRESRRLDKELRLVSANLRKLGALGAGPKWLIAFDDLDWADSSPSVSSAGRFLGDGWLLSPQSPLRVEFLSQDNGEFKGMKALVFTSRPGNLVVRRGKERFFANLLGMLNAELFYLGPLYAYSGGNAPLASGYVAALREGRLTPVVAGAPGRVELLQIIGPNRAVETVDAYH